MEGAVVIMDGFLEKGLEFRVKMGRGASSVSTALVRGAPSRSLCEAEGQRLGCGRAVCCPVISLTPKVSSGCLCLSRALQVPQPSFVPGNELRTQAPSHSDPEYSWTVTCHVLSSQDPWTTS